MNLSKQDSTIFIKLYWALLQYVNLKYPVIEETTNTIFKGREGDQIQLLYEILCSNVEPIDSFIDENPYDLSEEELDIIENWKTFVKGKFYVISHSKDHTIFLQPYNSPKAYAVLGLHDSIHKSTPQLPRSVETTLLPFKGQIIHSGIIYANRDLEEHEKNIIMDIYHKAKNSFGIIQSLDEMIVEDEYLDEDFADLIVNETNREWYFAEAELPEMPTEMLLEGLRALRLYINKKLAMEIAKRDDAVFWLRKAIQDGRYWGQEDYGDGWVPIHAIHILPLINTKEALKLLLDTIRYRNDELDSWLTEDIASCLIAFGEDAIEDLKRFSSDETLESFARSVATTALAFLANKIPSHKDDIKKHFLKLLNTTVDPTFASLLAGDLASFHDPSVMPDIRRAFKEDRMDGIIDSEEEIELTISGEYDDILFSECKKDPIDHFSRKNIEYLHSINNSEPTYDDLFSDEFFDDDDDPFEFENKEIPAKIKVGRNEPCPCGSGKKYKKCCMGKGA